jgi:N-acetylglucosaminyl-diphospho-decaprenol L-rhamnosyltransferase
MKDPGLDVVIVSYRSRDLLRSCLMSLRTHPPGVGARIWVVDNASQDGTPEMVRWEFPEVELFVSETNRGFSTANNLAIQRGRAPYVLALNPDTQLTRGSLDRMLELMEANPSIGIAGCRLEREDGTFDHAARRSFPTPMGALGHFTGIGRRSNVPGWLAQYRAPSVERGGVDAVNGAFMLMRRHALDEVGLFDEGYWMYMEDLDLCYRFARAGWTTWYEPSVRVLHVKGASSGPNRSLRLNYAFHYGMYRFYRKHYAEQSNLLVNLAVYAAIAGKLGVSIVRSAVLRRRAAAQTRGALDTRTGARPSES